VVELFRGSAFGKKLFALLTRFAETGTPPATLGLFPAPAFRWEEPRVIHLYRWLQIPRGMPRPCPG
jgi:hypothetical protein